MISVKSNFVNDCKTDKSPSVLTSSDGEKLDEYGVPLFLPSAVVQSVSRK